MNIHFSFAVSKTQEGLDSTPREEIIFQVNSENEFHSLMGQMLVRMIDLYRESEQQFTPVISNSVQKIITHPLYTELVNFIDAQKFESSESDNLIIECGSDYSELINMLNTGDVLLKSNKIKLFYNEKLSPHDKTARIEKVNNG